MHGHSTSISLIGRSRDLETLADLLARERLVTILGPPGIGKTRLAERHLEVHLARPAGGDAARFCDLTEATSIDDICRVVSQALDVPTHTGEDGAVVEQLGRAMAARGAMLLVLDNAEQIVAFAGATIGSWLRLAPSVQFLVTSRERLNLRSEVLFDLGPLSLPEANGDARTSAAVQLFVARAQAVSREYALTDDELPTVAAVVQRLDGIPLAIELASARMRLLTSAELLASLSLDIFSGNAADAPARHASLRQAIAWSWDALTPWEQDALAQGTVFRGGFDVGAAQAVLDLSAHPGAPSPLDALEALRNKSLLLRYTVPDEPARARFRLYVGVREFAREKLIERGDADAAKARHARYFLAQGRAWATAVDGPSVTEALDRLGVETENLLAVHRRALRRMPPTAQAATQAFEAALALGQMLRERGPFSLQLALLDGALGGPLASAVAPALRAEALLARGVARRAVGLASEGQVDLEQALLLADGASQPRLTGEIHVRLGWMHVTFSRAPEAEACFARALAVADRHVQALARARLPLLRWRQGRYGEAIEMLEEAQRLLREVGNRLLEAKAFTNLALMKAEVGRLEEACAHAERAISVTTALRVRQVWAVALCNWGLYEHARGRLDVAEPLYERGLQALREIGDARTESAGAVEGCLLYFATERGGEARALCEKALAESGRSGEPEEALALATLAGLDASEGRIEEARARFEAAEQRTFQGANVPAIFWVMRGHLELALARAARATGDPRAAAAHEEAARRRARCAPDAGAEESNRAASGTADSTPPVWLGLFPRLAQLSVARALALHAGPPSRDDRERNALLVSHAKRWFQRSGGERVSLARKPVLAPLLRGLLDHWERAPGVPVSIEALLQIGWPGEKMSEEAAVKRLYTAIWSLRQLGLADVIVQQEGGYLIDPDASIEITERRAGASRV